MESLNQLQSVVENYTVSPHPLSATRQRARDLLWELPDEISGATVTVDASGMESYAHCFVDELCKQILQVKTAESLTIAHGNEALKSQVDFCAQLRGLTDRVSFI